MTIKALFDQWTSLRALLIDPHLPDDDMDVLADQSMQVLQAMTQTPSTRLADVSLKLETYGREVQAGPCDACDALLGSALRDRMAILGELGYAGGGEAADNAVARRTGRAMHDDAILGYAEHRDPESPRL